MNVPAVPALDKDQLIQRLQAADGPADNAGVFPEALWEILVSVRAPLWSLPRELGGDELGRLDLIDRYAAIAEGSLTAAFILSQHDAAVRRMVAGPNCPQARIWLDRIARGEAFTTIGVSQLTTSRRLGSQAMRAEPLEDQGYRLNGAMPWVTAAERSQVLVTGAVLEDGRQILVVLPTDRAGVSVRPAFELAALVASRTTEVDCRDVVVRADELIGGPAADVMAHINAAGTGGLETSALALGQARAALRALETEVVGRDELAESIEVLKTQVKEVGAALQETAVGASDAPSSASVRARANAVALRSTQAYLTARRGRGFLLSDPAQRWARQALFFLVWSCPTPVANAAIRDLAGVCSL